MYILKLTKSHPSSDPEVRGPAELAELHQSTDVGHQPRQEGTFQQRNDFLKIDGAEIIVYALEKPWNIVNPTIRPRGAMLGGLCVISLILF